MALLRHDTARDLAPAGQLHASSLLPDLFFRARSARELHAWMLHDGSLTDRLARAFGKVLVTPDREGTGTPAALEAALLEHPRSGGWWIREITLAAGNRPRLRARTLVPPSSFALQQRLRGLGATPLGRVLFRRDRLRPEVKRGRRGFARAADGNWLRLTRYTVQRDHMLVIERILPAALTPYAPSPAASATGVSTGAGR